MTKYKKIVFSGNTKDESSFLSVEPLIEKYQKKVFKLLQ